MSVVRNWVCGFEAGCTDGFAFSSVQAQIRQLLSVSTGISKTMRLIRHFLIFRVLKGKWLLPIYMHALFHAVLPDNDKQCIQLLCVTWLHWLLLCIFNKSFNVVIDNVLVLPCRVICLGVNYRAQWSGRALEFPVCHLALPVEVSSYEPRNIS